MCIASEFEIVSLFNSGSSAVSGKAISTSWLRNKAMSLLPAIRQMEFGFCFHVIPTGTLVVIHPHPFARSLMWCNVCAPLWLHASYAQPIRGRNLIYRSNSSYQSCDDTTVEDFSHMYPFWPPYFRYSAARCNIVPIQFRHNFKTYSINRVSLILITDSTVLTSTKMSKYYLVFN